MISSYRLLHIERRGQHGWPWTVGSSVQQNYGPLGWRQTLGKNGRPLLRKEDALLQRWKLLPWRSTRICRHKMVLDEVLITAINVVAERMVEFNLDHLRINAIIYDYDWSFDATFQLPLLWSIGAKTGTRLGPAESFELAPLKEASCWSCQTGSSAQQQRSQPLRPRVTNGG